jgi:hypothetical protein
MISLFFLLFMGKQLVSFITCGCESSAPFYVNYKVGHELFACNSLLVSLDSMLSNNIILFEQSNYIVFLALNNLALQTF